MDAYSSLPASIPVFVFFASLKSTVLFVLILLLQKYLGRYLSANGRYLLWFALVLSLTTPVGYNMRIPGISFADDGEIPVAAVASTAPLPQQVAGRTVEQPDIVPQPTLANPANAQREGQAGPNTYTEPSLPISSESHADDPVTTPVHAPLEFTWKGALSVLWLAGALAVFAIVMIRSRRFSASIKTAVPASEPLQQMLQSCLQLTRCRANVRLMRSPNIAAPLVTGCFKPMLLLPEGLERALSLPQLRHVILHELMHVKRRDLASNWLVMLVQCVHWFNPLIWLAFSQMRHDRELACDAAVLNILKAGDGRAYGRTLLHLNQILPRNMAPANGTGILDSRTQLQRRIHMIALAAHPMRRQMVLASTLLIVLCTLACSQLAIDYDSGEQASDQPENVSASSSAPLQSGTRFGASMPVDLVRYLSGGGTIYSDAPPDFPPFALPDTIRLMGSHNLDYLQNLLYRTTLSGAQAEQAMVDVLTAEGWQVLITRRADPQYGFVIPASAAVDNSPAMLCHDDYGRLEVRGVDGSENRVFVRRFPVLEQASQNACGELIMSQQNPGISGPPPGANLFQYMPALQSADDFIAPPRPVIGIRGVDQMGMGSGISIRSDSRTPGSINEYYAAQLQDQGWKRDAAWAGTGTAGSKWLRTVEEELQLLLTLLVMQTEEQDFEVTMNMDTLE